MVKFIVDKEEVKQTFMVHKELAAFHSPFFKAAFESQMIEGQTQTMRLEDVDCKTFGYLNGWLYTAKIDESILEGLEGYENVVSLAKLWILGERFLILDLQNVAMAAMYNIVRAEPKPKLDQVKDFVVYASDRSESTPLMYLAVCTTVSALDKEIGASKSNLYDCTICDELPTRIWREITMSFMTSDKYMKSFPPLSAFMVLERERKHK